MAEHELPKYLACVAIGELEYDGVRLNLPGRECELVCYLAAVGRPARRDQILENVFPAAGATGRNLLKVYVSRLRGRLGPAAIITAGASYCAGANVVSDLAEATAALRSPRDVTSLENLRRYSDRVQSRHHPDWPWFGQFAALATELEIRVHLALASAHLHSDEHETAALYALRAVATDPLDERCRRLLFRARIAGHDPVRAKREAAAYARLLKVELGIDVSLSFRTEIDQPDR